MTNFANEIWIIILRHLHEPSPSEESRDLKAGFPRGIAALSRLCQVSKRFRALAEGILYQTLPPWKGYGDASRLPLLLRTLSTRCDLAQTVRSLDYGTWVDCYPNARHDGDDSDYQLLPTDEALRAFQEISLRFSSDECRILPSKEHLTCIGASLSSTGISQCDAQLAMLLIMLPNLELLVMHLLMDEDILATIQNWFLWHSTEVQNSIRTSLGSLELSHLTAPAMKSKTLAPLGNLKELHLRPRSSQYLSRQYPNHVTIFTQYLEALLLHRGIASLRGHNVFWCSRWNGQPPWSDELWGVEKLAITSASFDGPGLSNVVSRCPNLRSLYIEFAAPGMHTGEIGEVVREHGKGLESLSLLYCAKSDEGLGSLQSISGLKELAVTPVTLLGQSFGAPNVMTLSSTLADVLPASLEILRLESQHELEAWPGVTVLEKALYSLTSDNRFENIREIRWVIGTSEIARASTEYVNHCRWKVTHDVGDLVLTRLN